MNVKLFAWISLYCISTNGAVLVNKYVLWKLNFTYPTIFQSWQMSFAAFSMFSLYVLGFLESHNISVESIKTWFPATILFAISIYSGSVALAGLPIPIFCFIQQCVIHSFAYLSATEFTSYSVPLIAGIWNVGCLVAVLLLDVFYLNLKKYTWIFLHCLSNSMYSYYAFQFNKMLKLSEHDKLILNSICSILVLLFFGISTGETRILFNFPLLYNSLFLISCIGSGLCCAGIMISYVRLCQEYSLETVRFLQLLFISMVTVVSLFVFGSTLSKSMVIVIFTGFLSTVFLAFSTMYLNEDSGSFMFLEDKGISKSIPV